MSSTVRHLSFYDGRRRLGSFTIAEYADAPPIMKAKDADGKALGKFATESEAIAAIDAAASLQGTDSAAKVGATESSLEGA